uniref:Cupin type-1 domain-containing protein n=1 Tax=Populus alba TaxID=43335 RepID=A0A4U5PPV1_POPAL|nr:hypothetical protein D5086_0000203310 [Populus alba]
MEGLKFLIVFVVLALASSFASASDPSPLQDFYVAIKETDGVGSKCHCCQCCSNSGLNILGISLARIDFAPYGGLNLPHTHPRATEILVLASKELPEANLLIEDANPAPRIQPDIEDDSDEEDDIGYGFYLHLRDVRGSKMIIA